MSRELKTEGKYELFKSIEGKRILNLDNQAYYQFGEEHRSDFMAYSEPDPAKDSSISTGKYFLTGKKKESNLNGPFNLYLEEAGEFNEYQLPDGLPLQRNEPQKKLVATNKKLAEDEVRQRVNR